MLAIGSLLATAFVSNPALSAAPRASVARSAAAAAPSMMLRDMLGSGYRFSGQGVIPEAGKWNDSPNYMRDMYQSGNMYYGGRYGGMYGRYGMGGMYGNNMYGGYNNRYMSSGYGPYSMGGRYMASPRDSPYGNGRFSQYNSGYGMY